MTPRIPESLSTWLADWNLVTILGGAIPPRDPNDDDDAAEDEGEDDEDDDEPAVIREPDEDE